MEERYRELKQIIEQRYRELNQAIVRIEIEHGEKLDALFDAFKINNENIKKQNERIHRCCLLYTSPSPRDRSVAPNASTG